MSEDPIDETVNDTSEAESEPDCSEFQEQISKLQSELDEATRKNKDLSTQVSELEKRMRDFEDRSDRSEIEKTDLTTQISELTKKIDKKIVDNENLSNQVVDLTAQLTKVSQQHKEKVKEVKKLKEEGEELGKALGKAQRAYDELQEAVAKRDKIGQEQMDALVDQIGKLRGLIKQRDEELIQLQSEILAKNDAALGARQEVEHLRSVGIAKESALQDSTVLRRRVNDLEIELEQLKKALEKDSKYRVYMLVRETGQRTLEELSKVLGVGVFEARRRVQELVRSGLLTLEGETVHLGRPR